MGLQKNEEDIRHSCLEYQIKNYSINSDGSIDVDGNVDMSLRNLSSLPLKFARVLGNFCINNNLLTTLYGAPIAVGGNFNCFSNRLTNLSDAPKWVGGDFFCYQNQLASLKGSPLEVVGNYYISGNEYLENLEGCTLKIGGNFSCDDTLISTFSGEEDIDFEGVLFLNETHYHQLNDRKLPFEIIENRHHLKLILKYQRYFGIWNDDQTFNKECFNDLIADINEGLK